MASYVKQNRLSATLCVSPPPPPWFSLQGHNHAHPSTRDLMGSGVIAPLAPPPAPCAPHTPWHSPTPLFPRARVNSRAPPPCLAWACSSSRRRPTEQGQGYLHLKKKYLILPRVIVHQQPAAQQVALLRYRIQDERTRRRVRLRPRLLHVLDLERIGTVANTAPPRPSCRLHLTAPPHRASSTRLPLP